MDKQRRKFMKAFGLGTACLIGSKALEEVTSTFVKRVIPEDLGQAMYQVNAFKELFKNIDGQECKYAPGFAHHRFINQIHPDDASAVDAFWKLGTSMTENLVLVNDYLEIDNLSGNFVCLGSPMSNAISRKILQYNYVSNSHEDGIQREKNNQLFDLRYEYLMDANLLLREGIKRSKRFIGSKEHRVPNWSIIDKKRDELIIPDVKDEDLRSDYLLISVLPNLFNENSYEKNQQIIIFGGTHGVGTNAIDILLRNKKILSKITSKVMKLPYWQALLKIDETNYDAKRTAPFSISELDDDIKCVPIHLNNSAITNWFSDLNKKVKTFNLIG